VRPQPYTVGGVEVRNVAIVVEGTEASADPLVVGAHYDSARGTPGADDNASGTAALLALAGRLRPGEMRRSVHLVAFVNEEPPWFATEDQGAAVYARSLADAGVVVHGKLSLESHGYNRDEAGSQQYPKPFAWFYPNRGDFVGFVGTVASRRLVRDAIGAFRASAAFPSEGAVLPAFVPGVDWSDHRAFAAYGWPAAMVTDTAPYRNPHYHEPTDLPDEVDTERLARVVVGLEAVVRSLAAGP
jgi:Zn-dependent M28 family amino/carboxypeptidase